MRQVFYQAAGGVVIHNGKVLLLDRPSRNEMRLPKGHIEEDESPAEAALREVREEAGYANLAIVASLGTQRVRFIDPYRKRQVVREEHYFLMRLKDEQKIKRKEQELQFIAMWVPPPDAIARLTFEAEQEFVKRAVRWMQEKGTLRF